MPSAYAEQTDSDVARREIASALASLAGHPSAPPGKRQLTGPERAAVLMLALGEQHGAKVWGMLDDDELREISIVMSTIGTIEAELVENLLLKFAAALAKLFKARGNHDRSAHPRRHALPDQPRHGC